MPRVWKWCGASLRPNKSVFVLVLHTGLAGSWRSGVVLFHAHRHNDLEEHSNFSGTIFSFSILI